MPPEPPEPNSGDEYEDDEPQPEEQASGDEDQDETEDPDALAQRVQQEALEEWDSKTPRERLQYYYSLGSVEHGSPQREWEVEEIQELFRDWGVLDARDASEDEEDDEADEEADEDDHQQGSQAPVRNPRDRAREWKLPYGKRCWKIPPDAVEFQDDDFDYLLAEDGAALGHLLPAKSLPPWQQAGIMPRSIVKLRGTTANGERKQGLYTAIRVQNTPAPTDDDDLLRPIHKPVCTKAIEQWKKDLSKEDLERYALVMNYAPPEEPLNPGEMVGWTKIAPKDMPASALIAKVPTRRNFADGRHNGESNGASKKGSSKQAQLPFRQHAEQNGAADEEDDDDEPLSKRSSSEAFQNGNGSHAPSKKRARYSRVNQDDESSDDEEVRGPANAKEDEDEDYLGDEEEEEDYPPPAAPPVDKHDDEAFAEEETEDEEDVAAAADAPNQHNVTIPAAYFAKLVNHYYAHNPNGVP
tara:strand:- start:2137 stop:3543 length:1407 start_codon:yes stop_codon:yes gene_type:complete